MDNAPKRAANAAEGRTDARRRRYRSGLRGETWAALWLMSHGYRVLGRRVRTPHGEIDLIAARRGRVSFVEVKRRATLEAAEASMTARQRQRVRAAAQVWLTQNPAYQAYDVTFDLVFVINRRLPIHLVNAL